MSELQISLSGCSMVVVVMQLAVSLLVSVKIYRLYMLPVDFSKKPVFEFYINRYIPNPSTVTWFVWPARICTFVGSYILANVCVDSKRPTVEQRILSRFSMSCSFCG